MFKGKNRLSALVFRKEDFKLLNADNAVHLEQIHVVSY